MSAIIKHNYTEGMAAFDRKPLEERRELVRKWNARKILEVYEAYLDNFDVLNFDLADSRAIIFQEIERRFYIASKAEEMMNKLQEVM